MVDTPWGKISAKRVLTPTGPRVYPEYEECRKVARQHQVPLPDVYRAVLAAENREK